MHDVKKTEIAAHPDDKLLKEMAVGLIRGQFKDPTNAARSVLAAHTFGLKEMEANEHRLRTKYRENNWHAVGLEEVIQAEIASRGMTAMPSPALPEDYRNGLNDVLGDLLEGYIRYGRQIEKSATDFDGDQYLLEDLLHNWRRNLDSGREAVEQVVSALPAAVQRFLECEMIDASDRADPYGFPHNYPSMTVSFHVDPASPMLSAGLEEVAPGIAANDHMKIALGIPKLDPRLVAAERQALAPNASGYDQRRYRWRRPAVKADEIQFAYP